MSKAARQQSARERMREERRRQQARQRTTRRILIPAAAVIVVALVVGIGVLVQTQRASGGGEFAGQLPPGKLQNGAVAFAKGGGDKPVVDVWEDFQCPACQQFEQRSGDTLKKLVANGQAKVVYHPVAIIDQRSIRAGSAALCAAEYGKFMRYHDVLYENQPPESPVQGFETSTLQDYGDRVGIDDPAFDKCVASTQHRNAILRNTQQASQKPDFRGTPSVFVNGRKLGNVIFAPDALEQAILSAGRNQRGQ